MSVFLAFSFPLQAFLLSAFYFPLLFGGPLSGILMEILMVNDYDRLI
jgi:hypothetical protein